MASLRTRMLVSESWVQASTPSLASHVQSPKTNLLTCCSFQIAEFQDAGCLLISEVQLFFARPTETGSMEAANRDDSATA